MDYRDSFFRFFSIEFPIDCLLFHTLAWNHISREPVADTVLLWNYTWHSLSNFDPSTSALKTESTNYLVNLSIIIFITTEGFVLKAIRENFFYVFLSLGDRYNRFESTSLLSLCKPFSLSNFNLFFVCSLTRRLQDCFNKTLIHWRPWWMIWIGRHLIRCGWNDLNLISIFGLNIRKLDKCFTSYEL